MGWFVTSLTIGFLNCNEHLQFIATQRISTCEIRFKDKTYGSNILVTH